MNWWKRTAGLAATAVLHSLAAQLPAVAQETEEASGAIEEIVVVGTAIRGTPIDAPHAVSVVDREALEQQGAPLMVD
ncbi:MAG: TonB-dependent receptor, partial [Chromatiales bacterium]|nr:TonB-dependent receptor [Chromatiales bacterium]